MINKRFKVVNTNGFTEEEIKQSIDKYNKLVMEYNYNVEDFVITSLEIQEDTMNSCFIELRNDLVCIPKEFENTACTIVINFTCDNIQILDKDGQLLYRTCDVGYDDIELPKFFVNHKK